MLTNTRIARLHPAEIPAFFSRSLGSLRFLTVYATHRAGGAQFHKNITGVTPAGNFYPLVATPNQKVSLSPGFDEVSGVDAYRRGCRKMLFAECFALSPVRSEIDV